MPLPTRPDVKTKVWKLISVFSDTDESDMEDAQELAKRPLSMDSTALTFLATSCRQYVRQHNEDATITAGEVKKSGLKVSELVDLVYERIRS